MTRVWFPAGHWWRQVQSVSVDSLQSTICQMGHAFGVSFPMLLALLPLSRLLPVLRLEFLAQFVESSVHSLRLRRSSCLLLALSDPLYFLAACFCTTPWTPLSF